tara:strand:+ start:289 stop:579 length:291 start_codon:yes stop_codon:yes gene_type:complete
MSEKKEGFFSQLKNQIIAGVGVILTGLGGLFMDEVKSFIGIEDESSAPVQVEQKQEVNVEGPTIVVNIPEQKKDTVVKKVYVKPKKKKEKEEEIDW